MTFRAAVPDQPKPSTIYDQAINRARQVLDEATSLRDDSAAGNVSGSRVFDYYNSMIGARTLLLRAKDTPGLKQYAIEQENDPAYDIEVEFPAMMAAIDSVIAWLSASAYSGGRDHFLADPVTDVLVWADWSSTQTAGLRSQLDLLIATIA
jgi:hypothetical protein